MDEWNEERWQVARDAVLRRMDELMLTPTKLTERSSISFKTLSPLLKEAHPIKRRDKRRALALALSWNPDHLDRLLDGEEPEPPNEQTQLFRAMGEVTDRLEALVRDVVQVQERLRESLGAGSLESGGPPEEHQDQR